MDRNQRIVVILILGGAVLAVFGAWWLSQRPEVVQSVIEARPFRAKPGTERENRLEYDSEAATVPSGQEADPDAEVPTAPTDDASDIEDDTSDIEEDESGETPTQDDEPVEQYEEEPEGVAAEALQNPDTNAGLETLATALAAASLAEASSLYAAAGTLFLQRIPPDEEAAMSAFDQALTTATDPLMAHRAAMPLAEMHLMRGDPDQAMAVVLRVLPTTEEVPAPSRAVVRLRLFQGGLFDDAGDIAQAYACFQQAWTNARVIYMATGDDDALSVYRQASLALARHHRRQGDEVSADTVLAQMRAVIGEE